MFRSLGVDLSSDSHLECVLGYDRVGLAPAADIARTPSFVLWVPRTVSRRAVGVLVLWEIQARQLICLMSADERAGRSRGFGVGAGLCRGVFGSRSS